MVYLNLLRVSAGVGPMLAQEQPDRAGLVWITARNQHVQHAAPVEQRSSRARGLPGEVGERQVPDRHGVIDRVAQRSGIQLQMGG